MLTGRRSGDKTGLQRPKGFPEVPGCSRAVAGQALTTAPCGQWTPPNSWEGGAS